VFDQFHFKIASFSEVSRRSYVIARSVDGHHCGAACDGLAKRTGYTRGRRAESSCRVSLYDSMGAIGGFGLADLLASFALFDDNPARINTLVSEFEKVTPQLVQKKAQEYLRPENRTVLGLETKSAEAPAAPAKN
jgi:hypothetical protein